MPKKRTGKALLIKPGSSAAIASSSASRDDGANRPSVNDLIRESRRLQLKDQSVPSSQPIPSSVPPQLRDVLSLPAPVTPSPRPGIRRTRPTPTPTSERGPSRIRTVPGPPPPKSWLIDSRHATHKVSEDEYRSMRRLDDPLVLPGAQFPTTGSLIHSTLKEFAVNWEWHVSYDGMYLRDMPVKLREALLSYIAVYNDHVESNPLRMLFLAPEDTQEDGAEAINDDHGEITRLDLAGGISNWTRLKQLEKDLVTTAIATPSMVASGTEVPDSWDMDQSSPTPSLRIGLVVPNLKHLSLASTPSTTTSPSWKQLLQLASHLPTLESLSLAYWPIPTYTPNAASTHVLIKQVGSAPRTVFGATSMYSRLDNDFRESAGILRTLSSRLHSLSWLDLTGCGGWWDALVWQPPSDSSEADEDFSVAQPQPASNELADTEASPRTAATNHGPDWNGAWRSIKHIGLKIGYTPIEPEPDPAGGVIPTGDAQHDAEMMALRIRRNGLLLREKTLWTSLKERQETTIRKLREIRRNGGGRWIDFEV